MYNKVIELYILFHIIVHRGLPQDIECGPLCCIVEPYCLSILYIIAYIYSPQTPNPSHPLATTKPVFYVYESVYIS